MAKHTVEAALLALSSVDQDHARDKNGVGFNGRDTGFGNSLARQVSAGRDLSPKQYGTAYRMLKTYRVQLATMGVEYDQIAPPEKDNASKEATKTVDFVGGFFAFQMPFLPELRDALKESIPGRRWDADAKVWTAPPESAAAVGKFALRNGFTPTTEALKYFEHVAGAVASDHSDDVANGENWKLSWADESDFEVEVPEGLELRGFQKADIEYAVKNLKPGKGVYFGDEMGLGKTPQSLLVLREKDAYPAIIAMPRVVWLKWALEVQKWTPGKRVILLAGRVVTKKTIAAAEEFGATVVKLGDPLPEADIYLVKYPVLYKWAKPVGRKVANSKNKKTWRATGALKDLDAAAVIWDEAHYLKEDGSQRTRAAEAITKTCNPSVRLALSGTPMPNRPKELMPMLRMLGRLKDVAASEWDYLLRYCAGYQNNFGWDFSGTSNGEELNFKMRSNFYAQHEKLDRVIDGVTIPGVLRELSEPVPDYIPADLENPARYDVVQDALDDKKSDYSRAMRSLENARTEEQLKKWRAICKKLENEVGVLSNEARKVCGEEKVKFSIEWIQDILDAGEKLIVFGYHRSVNEQIADHFSAPLIYGGQNEAVRQENQDRFQEDPDCRLVVCQVEAAGVGINLTEATSVAFVEFPYRPGDIDQAIGRAFGRLNDVHGVNVYFLIAYGTIETHIRDEVLAPKRDSQKKVVSGA